MWWSWSSCRRKKQVQVEVDVQRSQAQVNHSLCESILATFGFLKTSILWLHFSRKLKFRNSIRWWLMSKWMTRKKIHQAPKIKNVQVQGLRLIPQYFLDQPPRPTPVTFQRYHTLSYKLRCYTRISSPEKSLNNTREKIRYLFTCVWHRQSAADMSLAFRATRSG